MRVAIVASSFLPERGRLERRVVRLARGMAQRGVEVEILTQGPARSTIADCEGLVVRRFVNAAGPFQAAVAPGLWQHARQGWDAFDIVDVHSRGPLLALAVARASAPRVVFTPGGPMDVFVAWPHVLATRSLIAATAGVICHSERDRDLLCQTIPAAEPLTQVVPDGLEVDELGDALPFVTDDVVLLAVDRLDRGTGVHRAIAAMPSLGPECRLVIVGDGTARRRLAAYAADLRVADRVQFVGAVPDAVLYRWLRTARVVIALSDERGSGSLVAQARAVGAPVVASDVPVHRRAAEGPGTGHMIFVIPRGSPLDVADAIEIAADEAVRISVLPTAQSRALAPASWESVVHSTALLYEQVVEGSLPGVVGEGVDGTVALAAQSVGRGGRQWP